MCQIVKKNFPKNFLKTQLLGKNVSIIHRDSQIMMKETVLGRDVTAVALGYFYKLGLDRYLEVHTS